MKSSQEFFLLLSGPRGKDSRRTQTATGKAMVHSHITPAQRFDLSSEHLIANRRTFFPFFAFLAVSTRSQTVASHGFHRRVHKLDVIPWNLMLMLIEVTRARAHHLLGNSLQNKLSLHDWFRWFKFDGHD